MPRQKSISAEYNFSQGLVTEATGLNFPENACTETYNCVFDETGPVSRRPPIDFEANYTTTSINREAKAVTTYSWEAVGDEGDFSLVVLQVGDTLYFYNTAATSLSRGYISGSQVDLSPFFSPGALHPEIQECTYASGLGYLFVFHPSMDPIYISYDPSTVTLTAASTPMQIRDLAGVEDNKSVNERPTSQSTEHQYNSYNQGWNVDLTKTDVITFTNGSNNIGWPSHGLVVGDIVYFTTDGSLPTNFTADVPNYVVSVVNADKITVSATAAGTAIVAGSAGSGNHKGHTYTPYDLWTTLRSDYPSNADVWWDFKDETNKFDLSYVSSYSRGTSPAPRGHYILDLFNQDRDTASGLSGITTVTYDERPSVGEFFAGRVWYSGIPNTSLNNKIYYSQLVEDISQIGSCCQKQDPTSEDLSVVLATDGGEITILDIGTVYYMKAAGTSLLMFAKNGIWAITGSQGLGFSPTDYSIVKVSDIGAISPTNFVDIKSAILWWNDEGVYAIRQGQNGFEIRSLTDDRIRTFYLQIPAICKKQARGAYNSRDGVVTWVYRTTVSSDITSIYNYNAILKLNTKTGAFYPWLISEATPQIHDVLTSNVIGQSTTTAFNVVNASSNKVIDASGNFVVAFNYTTYATSVVTTKYLTSYYSGGSYYITWSEELPYESSSVNNYLDWYKYDSTGVNYSSYFISGYKLRGDGQRKFQANYLYMFSDTEENLPTYDVTARWDYSTSANSGRWPNTQRVSFTDTKYKFQRRKLKVRGNGLTVQFKCASIEGEPMNITGWSVFETVNTGI